MSAVMFMRYEPEIYREDRVRMEPDQDGDYIKFIDAQVEIERLKALNAELAEACQSLIDFCDKNKPMGESLWCIQQIRAALAKHKGETA